MPPQVLSFNKVQCVRIYFDTMNPPPKSTPSICPTPLLYHTSIHLLGKNFGGISCAIIEKEKKRKKNLSTKYPQEIESPARSPHRLPPVLPPPKNRHRQQKETASLRFIQITTTTIQVNKRTKKHQHQHSSPPPFHRLPPKSISLFALNSSALASANCLALTSLSTAGVRTSFMFLT